MKYTKALQAVLLGTILLNTSFVQSSAGRMRTNKKTGNVHAAEKNSTGGVTSTTTTSTGQLVGTRSSSNQNGTHSSTEQSALYDRSASRTKDSGGSATATDENAKGKYYGYTTTSTNAAGLGGRSHTVTSPTGETKSTADGKYKNELATKKPAIENTFKAQFAGKKSPGAFASIIGSKQSPSSSSSNGGSSNSAIMSKAAYAKKQGSSEKGAEMSTLAVEGAAAKQAQTAEQNSQSNSGSDSTTSSGSGQMNIFNQLVNTMQGTPSVSSNSTPGKPAALTSSSTSPSTSSLSAPSPAPAATTPTA